MSDQDRLLRKSPDRRTDIGQSIGPTSEVGGSKKKKCTINMFCLSSPHFTTTPTLQEQRGHAAAGLSKKRIEFGDRDGDQFDFLGTLQEEYPKLPAVGETFTRP